MRASGRSRTGWRAMALIMMAALAMALSCCVTAVQASGADGGSPLAALHSANGRATSAAPAVAAGAAAGGCTQCAMGGMQWSSCYSVSYTTPTVNGGACTATGLLQAAPFLTAQVGPWQCSTCSSSGSGSHSGCTPGWGKCAPLTLIGGNVTYSTSSSGGSGGNNGVTLAHLSCPPNYVPPVPTCSCLNLHNATEESETIPPGVRWLQGSPAQWAASSPCYLLPCNQTQTCAPVCPLGPSGKMTPIGTQKSFQCSPGYQTCANTLSGEQVCGNTMTCNCNGDGWSCTLPNSQGFAVTVVVELLPPTCTVVEDFCPELSTLPEGGEELGEQECKAPAGMTTQSIGAVCDTTCYMGFRMLGSTIDGSSNTFSALSKCQVGPDGTGVWTPANITCVKPPVGSNIILGYLAQIESIAGFVVTMTQAVLDPHGDSIYRPTLRQLIRVQQRTWVLGWVHTGTTPRYFRSFLRSVSWSSGYDAMDETADDLDAGPDGVFDGPADENDGGDEGGGDEGGGGENNDPIEPVDGRRLQQQRRMRVRRVRRSLSVSEDDEAPRCPTGYALVKPREDLNQTAVEELHVPANVAVEVLVMLALIVFVGQVLSFFVVALASIMLCKRCPKVQSKIRTLVFVFIPQMFPRFMDAVFPLAATVILSQLGTAQNGWVYVGLAMFVVLWLAIRLLVAFRGLGKGRVDESKLSMHRAVCCSPHAAAFLLREVREDRRSRLLSLVLFMLEGLGEAVTLVLLYPYPVAQLFVLAGFDVISAVILVRLRPLEEEEEEEEGEEAEGAAAEGHHHNHEHAEEGRLLEEHKEERPAPAGCAGFMLRVAAGAQWFAASNKGEASHHLVGGMLRLLMLANVQQPLTCATVNSTLRTAVSFIMMLIYIGLYTTLVIAGLSGLIKTIVRRRAVAGAAKGELAAPLLRGAASPKPGVASKPQPKPHAQAQAQPQPQPQAASGAKVAAKPGAKPGAKPAPSATNVSARQSGAKTVSRQ